MPVKQDFKAGQSYNVELQRLVREIRKDINENIVPLIRKLRPEYTADAWPETITQALDAIMERWTSPLLDFRIRNIVRRFVTTTSETNRRRNESLGVDVFTGNQQLQNAVSAAAYDNVRLIKTIPQQYLDNVASIVTTNMRAGNRPSAIVELLSGQFGVTQRRAKFIARDQTAKINGDLNRVRQQEAGFPYFEWDDSDDERVRKRHDEIANRVTQYGPGIYRWDNPPLSDRGTPIIPGQDFNCRCVARPVSQAEVDGNVAAGRTRPGVLR